VAENPEDLKHTVEGGGGIFVVRRSATQRQWNGISYKTGLSAKNVSARKLSMNVATIPPGGVAYAHIHVDFDVMLYILQGRVRHEYGPGLTKKIDNEAGDFIYIEPGVPHEVFNLSDASTHSRSGPCIEEILQIDFTRAALKKMMGELIAVGSKTPITACVGCATAAARNSVLGHLQTLLQRLFFLEPSHESCPTGNIVIKDDWRHIPLPTMMDSRIQVS
jgi:uncharacterized RmlC-like cupin family protein